MGTQIKAFPEDSVLTPTKSLESASGASLLVQEMVVRDVETFNKAELRPAETQEPMTGAELLKKELDVASLNAEVVNFDKAGLKEAEVGVKDILPNERDINLEKEKVELIGGIENFDIDNLARVTVREPASGAELLKQELGLQSINAEVVTFDKADLRETDVEVKNTLPDQQVIQGEKDKANHLASIQSFQADDLNKVKTQEPLSGAELLKHELTLKAVTEEVVSFDAGKMKQTEVEERNLLPDAATLAEAKSRETLLAGVETFPHESLSHVRTPEPVTGAELLQQEMNIKSIVDSVSTFDSSSLVAVTTEEKVLLPDAETLKSERDRASLLANIESGDHSLTPVSPKEPLGGAELLKQELTRAQVLEKVEGFDIGELRHSEVVERIQLPDEATIHAERTHVEHLATIGKFDQDSLTPVKVLEPLTGPEVAKLEMAREGISSELANFDKADLNETEVEEKVVLPGKEEIEQEREHLQHMAGLEAGLELRKTETREPTNPLDLAKLELHKDQVEEEIQAFDRTWGAEVLLHMGDPSPLKCTSDPATPSSDVSSSHFETASKYNVPYTTSSNEFRPLDLSLNLEERGGGGSSLMKFSRSLRERLSQSPVGRLKEKLSKSPSSAHASPAVVSMLKIKGKTDGTESTEGNDVNFPLHEMVEPILLGKSTSSIPKGSVKKMRLKDRLPTSKLTTKHKKKPTTNEDRGSRESLKVRSESMKRESAASFPEVDSSGSQSRADQCSRTNAVYVGRTPSTSMNELRNASNASFLNNVKVPPKPPRAFQNRPAWRN